MVDASRLRNELAYANDVFSLPRCSGKSLKIEVAWDGRHKRPALVCTFVQKTPSRPLQVQGAMGQRAYGREWGRGSTYRGL